MAGTWKWFGLGLKDVATGVIVPGTDTLKIALATSSWTPNQDTDHYRSAATAAEPGNSGTYAAGGSALTGFAATYDAATNEVRFAWSTPVSWTSATITARTAYIYKSRGGAASADELLAYCTEASDITSTAGTFSLTLPSPTLKWTAA